MLNNSAPVVEISALTVRRGGRPVIDHLDLSIPGGEVVGLLGPSGCGKTTLMRSIVGVQVIASGTVTVLGQVAGTAALRRRVAYVTQAASVYDDLTVAQNIGYFRRVLGAPADDVARVIEATDLTPYTRRLAGSLSGGERSRVSLAVALLGSPELLILDEPTVGLDPVLRAQLWGLFRRLAAREGTSLVISSHVMDEATRCDRLLLMREGAILADLTPAELLSSTGTSSPDEAFLTLIRSRTASDPGTTGADSPRPHRRAHAREGR
jgi:ABC-2 type transport system ATP-binding protein